MNQTMPSQVVSAMNRLFPDIYRGHATNFTIERSGELGGLVDLIKRIPQELIILTPEHYANLVVGVGSIEHQLRTWEARGGQQAGWVSWETMARIWAALKLCPDEYPPPATAELLFVGDVALRDNLRGDMGAVNRALAHAEWKAATVLAGSAIEALLHWKLVQSPPTAATISSAVANRRMAQPKSNDPDDWSLQHFIGVAEEMGIIRPETVVETKLAQNYRNLIHPGRSARLGQLCDRGTAYSAVAALEHVVRDLS